MSKNKKAIVIGGGLGGMSASISLASEGFHVELYEKNDHLGGKLNTSRKNGFLFDLGPSILTMPHIFENLFQKAGKDMENYIDIKKLDLQWRNFFEDGKRIDLYGNPKKIVENNSNLTKKDRKDLEKFMGYSQSLYETAKKSYFDEGLDTLWEIIKFHGPITSIRKFDYFHTMNEGVEKRISNKYLKYIMDFFIKYVGSSPYDAPAVLNMLPYIQFEFGLWYVNEGMFNLSNGLKKLMEELGVKTHLKREVTKMKHQNKKVKSIILDNGNKVEGDIFISNMEVIPAYKNLLNEKNKMLKKYQKKFEPACSGYVIHLGVDRKYDQLSHHNFFFSKDPREHFKSVYEDKKIPKDPTIYLVAPTRTDDSIAPEGHEIIKALPHIPHLQDEPFTEEEYSTLRRKVLEKLERMGLKDLRNHIVTEDIWTPEDIKNNYYSNKGAIYGVLSDKSKNKGFKAPKKSEKYSNLYFTGGSVNPGGGMPMVVLSGQQVSDKILKEMSKK